MFNLQHCDLQDRAITPLIGDFSVALSLPGLNVMTGLSVKHCTIFFAVNRRDFLVDGLLPLQMSVLGTQSVHLKLHGYAA